MNRPLFTPRATQLFRLVLLGVPVVGALGGFGWYRYYHSPLRTGVGIAPDQPVLFSHRHHAGELRLDCRYCHTSVETSAFAGMPSTQTCLTCHSQLFTDTRMLQPVVLSASRGEPLRWNRVNALPDHVYFDHSAHVSKGVACATCHGDVGDMALTAKAQALDMRWCIDCHRDPTPHLRAREDVFASRAPPPSSPAPAGSHPHPELLRPPRDPRWAHLTNCSTCHR